jgi:hypothetical protein
MKINWKIVIIISLIIGLIILNRIPYTYKEVSSGEDFNCYYECYPNSFVSFQENKNYSNTQEVLGWEDNHVVKTNQTFSGDYISTTCKCQTTLLKKSFSWILNNNKYD